MIITEMQIWCVIKQGLAFDALTEKENEFSSVLCFLQQQRTHRKLINFSLRCSKTI